MVRVSWKRGRGAATKPANGWGLHDVGANANEWCWDSGIEREDRSGESYYRIATYEEFIGISRVEFDGDFRFFTIPFNYRYPNLGFRAVRGVVP